MLTSSTGEIKANMIWYLFWYFVLPDRQRQRFVFNPAGGAVNTLTPFRNLYELHTNYRKKKLFIYSGLATRHCPTVIRNTLNTVTQIRI